MRFCTDLYTINSVFWPISVSDDSNLSIQIRDRREELERVGKMIDMEEESVKGARKLNGRRER